VALAIAPLALGALAAVPATTTPAHAQAAAACDVTFSASPWNDGNGGFTASLTITNLGDPINGWTLAFDLPGSAQLTHGWSATWNQQGQTVTAQDLGWNANLGTGGQTTIGFNGSGYAGDDPTAFTLNGTTCGDEPGGNTAPSVQITAPTDGQQFTAPATVSVAATASDPDGQVARVEFSLNGQLLGEDTSAPYEWQIPNLQAGSHTIGVTAFDDASPPATASDAVNILVAETSEPAIVASPTSLTVPGGGDADFTLVLSEQPSSNVNVSLAATGDPVTVTPDALTFTPTSWNQPQTVTVSAPESSESAEITASAAGFTPATIAVTVTGAPVDNIYIERFLEQYDKIKSSGYFSPQGIPYHSIETLIVEAPDHGHETTSEAFSYWLWLEANYGRVTGDWEPFNQAWQTMEQFIIPSSADQPSSGAPGTPQYAAEHLSPADYPSPLQPEIPVGEDPLRTELASTYGTSDIYGMHWLLDVDNTYGYGRCGDGTTTPSYINTFQRGPQESVWETVPHPSCETKDFGGEHGFLELFISEENDPATQWRYTNAPDADARAVQAAYWAHTWASEQGNADAVSASVANAAKMGDYLRYSLFDKYFKEVGNCVGASTCPAGQGRNSAHFLLSWFYAWGGSFPGNEWSWRIGSSASHFGYQNPVAAWALINEPALQPDSPTANADWTASLQRQIEFYRWLQSAEGGIAGGATNSWEGAYAEPPAGTATFYGLFYDEKPVFHDPPSNQWFGFQVWSMQRVAEYYWITGDPQVEDLLANWVDWAMANTTVNGSDFAIPATLGWQGQPESYNGEPGGPGPNPDLHVSVVETGQDVGVTSALARTLTWWAAASGDDAAKTMGQDLLDALSANADDQGIATVETRADYERFDDVFDPSTEQGIFIPDGWSGQMANGDVIEPGVSFLDIRSFYLDDPAWPEVQQHLDGGPAPQFTYHRFWAQADIAAAFADFGFLFPNG
jgi:hypothetical protein